MTSSQKVTQSVCWLRNLNISLETYQILTTSQWIRPISCISTPKCCFPVNLRHKSENPRWRPPVTSSIWLLLPWKPIRDHVVSLNWKYKWSLLCVPNFKSIGWIMSKVEGFPIDPPPPPPRLRVTIFSRRLLGLNIIVGIGCTFGIFHSLTTEPTGSINTLYLKAPTCCVRLYTMLGYVAWCLYMLRSVWNQSYFLPNICQNFLRSPVTDEPGGRIPTWSDCVL